MFVVNQALNWVWESYVTWSHIVKGDVYFTME